MIEINLLPEELKKKERGFPVLNIDLQAMGKIKYIAAGGVAAFLVFLIFALAVGSSVRKKQIIKLLAMEQAIAPERERAEKTNKEILYLMAKIGELDKITKRRFLWSKKLNELSDIVLPGIWFTRIHTDAEGRFIIEGKAVSGKEEAMALVGKFMKDMKEDKDFFKDFKNIKLESVQRGLESGRDIVEFVIALYMPVSESPQS